VKSTSLSADWGLLSGKSIVQSEDLVPLEDWLEDWDPREERNKSLFEDC